MKEIDKVRQVERRQQKFKTRLMMQKKKIKNILGQSRTIPSLSKDLEAFELNLLLPPNSERNRPDMDSLLGLHDSGTSVWSTNSHSGKSREESRIPMVQTDTRGEVQYRLMARDKSQHRDTTDSCYLQMPSTTNPNAPLRMDRDSISPSDPPIVSLAVLREEEEDDTLQINKQDRQILINIDNIQAQFTASSV
jgi:hypothetical protein